MRRLKPLRPNPRSVVKSNRSGGIYSSALRTSPATMLGQLDGGDAMVDDADADLFVGLVLGEEKQVPAIARRAFESDDVGIELK